MSSPPEKIFNWRGLPRFQIAARTGHLVYQGKEYVIDFRDKRQPLIRRDVVVARAKAAMEEMDRE